MTVEAFLELFIKELEQNKGLRHYYRLLENKSRFLWRKSYLEQRLRYVNNQLANSRGNIWDVGCGYGTTAIFLAINGYNVWGNTLEFYYNQISTRLNYWSQFGNLENLRLEYANLYDLQIKPEQYDYIIAQDTLHHLEPIDEAVRIFASSLKPEGKLIATEENGNSLFIRIKNFSRRGFKRVGTYYDEKLNKTIPFGNENARGMESWRKIFQKQGFSIIQESTEYIRLYPHFFYDADNYQQIPQKEAKIAGNLATVGELLFFGINFTAIKSIRHG